MSDLKNELIRNYQAKLAGLMDGETARKAVDALVLLMGSYMVVENEKQIAVIDDNGSRFVKLFLATKKLEGRSDKTIKHYEYILNRFLKTTGLDITSINVYHLRHYLAGMEMNGVSVNTIAGIRHVFCSFFGWLYNEHLIENNPCSQLGVVRQTKKIEMPFSLEEVERIRLACTLQRDRAIIEFLRCTGCRINEVTTLNRSDIDFHEMQCKVQGKGGKERFVYLDEICVLYLRMYLKERKDDYEALFVGKGTSRMTNDGIRVMLNRIAERSGVSNIHPHRFRRTLASELIRHGMPVQNVGTILGHSNLNTTLRYVHISDSTVKNEYRKFAA